MRIAPIADVKARLSEYVTECRNGAVVVTRNGRPAAALVAIRDDEDLERILLSESPALRRLLADAEKRMRAGHSVGHAEFWQVADSRRRDKPRARAPKRRHG
jgi:prevent-host-death family protein